MKKNTVIISVIVLIALIISAIVYVVIQNNREKSDTSEINRNANLADITFNDDKINIYFFWGNGCEHCKELFAYFEDNYEEISKYANIYAYEVWYNKGNGEIMDALADELGDNIGRTVPYYIIGDKSFSGYNSSKNSEIKETIINKYENRDSIKDFSEIIANLKKE